MTKVVRSSRERGPCALVAWVSLAIATSACNGGDIVAPEIHELPRALTADEQVVIQSSNAFGFDLFARVFQLETGPNVFLSPISASMALGMTMNGAAGETWNGMRDALHFRGLSETAINESYRGLMDLLLDLDPLVDVRIGNSVWARQGFPFEPAFFTAVSDYFDAEAHELDFNQPSAIVTINKWASDATNGRIDKVLDQIDPAHIMFLLNALYFKGTWERQFDKDETRPAPFMRRDGSSINVPTMYLPEGAVLSTGTSEYRAIELAYGGKAYAMVIVVPTEGRTLADVVSLMDADEWTRLTTSLDSTNLEVRMPRFRLEYEELLNRPLIDMGMGIAFSSGADFTRLTPAAQVDPVCIHFVKQNTFVDVNEEGTEAAAVTTVGIGIVSARPSFVVDRPFLFAVRERFSGSILFLGTIGDPTAEKSAPADRPGPVC